MLIHSCWQWGQGKHLLEGKHGHFRNIYTYIYIYIYPDSLIKTEEHINNIYIFFLLFFITKKWKPFNGRNLVLLGSPFLQLLDAKLLLFLTRGRPVSGSMLPRLPPKKQRGSEAIHHPPPNKNRGQNTASREVTRKWRPKRRSFSDPPKRGGMTHGRPVTMTSCKTIWGSHRATSQGTQTCANQRSAGAAWLLIRNLASVVRLGEAPRCIHCSI